MNEVAGFCKSICHEFGYKAADVRVLQPLCYHCYAIAPLLPPHSLLLMWIVMSFVDVPLARRYRMIMTTNCCDLFTDIFKGDYAVTYRLLSVSLFF